MTEKKTLSNQANYLRRQAEEEAAKMTENWKTLSLEETRHTLHELRVHQIEIEMQNEELRRKQAQLEDSRARYFDLYDMAPVGYCTLGENGLILEANLTASTLLGVARGALVERPISLFIHKEDQSIYYFHRKQLFDIGEPHTCELRMVKKDGTAFWAFMEATVAQDVDGSTISRIVMSDISARKRYEQTILESHDQLEQQVLERTLQLRQEVEARKLAQLAAEEGNLAKSSFLANMSHEIRTPLSGVIGLAGLLLETPLTGKARRYAEMILTSGKSLLAILNDILDFSRIEAGKLAVESILFSMQEVIGNVINIFIPLAAEKGIALHAAIDPKLPATLLGDPKRLAQVISNLMDNAVKFTAAGDIHLSVWVRRRTTADAELEISVQDTGIGITEEELSRLFTAFSQADYSTTRRFGGSGLGLAICRQLVEFMGGTINTKSTLGKGSLFTVVLSLPIASGVRLTDLQRHQEMPRGLFAGVRALVAEDHAINREIILALLRRAGIEADIAVNGSEAVESVRAHDYDILFMDIQMPEMDGFTATRQIRNLDREGVDRLPILALSSYAWAGDREKSLAAGMNDHLIKPIDPDTLDAALRQWLPPEKCVAVAADKLDLFTISDFMSIPPHPALDVEGGLNRLGGNRKLYLKLLRDFVAMYGETPALLLQELRTVRREDAIHRVHAIRGVAGSLGGKEMEAAATELEQACQVAENAGNDIPFALGEPLRVFIDRHEALMIAIGVVLAGQPPVLAAKPEGPPGTAAELHSLLNQLKLALASKEPLPCKKILEVLLKRRWSEDHESGLAEVNCLVQQYRLAEALAFLNKEFNDVMKKTKERDDDQDHD